jgi:hypothetical protein
LGVVHKNGSNNNMLFATEQARNIGVRAVSATNRPRPPTLALGRALDGERDIGWPAMASSRDQGRSGAQGICVGPARGNMVTPVAGVTPASPVNRAETPVRKKISKSQKFFLGFTIY